MVTLYTQIEHQQQQPSPSCKRVLLPGEQVTHLRRQTNDADFGRKFERLGQLHDGHVKLVQACRVVARRLLLVFRMLQSV